MTLSQQPSEALHYVRRSQCLSGQISACMALAFVLSACTQEGPPRGVGEVVTPQAVTTNVVGGAAAAQTGAPQPSAPVQNKVAGGDAAGSMGAPAAAAAAEVYAQRCALCHGPKGVGNGVAADNLRPKPRNLRDAAWQKATPDAEIAAIILKGGAGVGKSMMMPANPDLADKSEVVEALVRIVRSFGN